MTEAKKKSCRRELYDLFSKILPISYEYGKLIDAFIDGTILPLENALVKKEQKEAQE